MGAAGPRTKLVVARNQQFGASFLHHCGEHLLIPTNPTTNRARRSRFKHQADYIDFWLKFIGVKEVRTLVVEGTTWGGKEKGEESIARGQEEAKKLAADF